MNPDFPIYAAQFYTATINDWNDLLKIDQRKNIIIESLKFLVTNKRIELSAFVIMNNHIHLIWQPLFQFTPSAIQASFMKYTAQQLKRSLNEGEVEKFRVNKYDRDYQIWKREPLSVELPSLNMFKQKLDYIHYNPVKAGICPKPEDYYYSSARFYFDGIDTFEMLTHFSGS